MGYRMSIQDVDTGLIVGDTHKFYGYFDFTKCESSFSFIFRFIKEQGDDLGFNEKEFYNLKVFGGIPFEIELPIELFDTFKLLYLIDLGKCRGFNSYAFQHAAEDFKLMDMLDGDKRVFWS